MRPEVHTLYTGTKQVNTHIVMRKYQQQGWEINKKGI